VKSHDPVVIVSAVRTPLGRYLGELASVSAPALGAHVIRHALQRAQLGADRVDEVLMGCVLPAGQGPGSGKRGRMSSRSDETHEMRHIGLARLLAGEGAQIGGEVADARLDRFLEVEHVIADLHVVKHARPDEGVLPVIAVAAVHIADGGEALVVGLVDQAPHIVGAPGPFAHGKVEPRVEQPLVAYVTSRGSLQDPVYLYGSQATIALKTGGGQRIVDSGMQIIHGDRVYPTEKWDTVTLVELGHVPLDIVTTAGLAKTLVLDVVSKPDDFVITAPKEMPSVLTTGAETQFCMYGTSEGRYLANATWTWTVTNANWDSSNGLGDEVPGCVRVRPTTPGQRVEITANVAGATKTLAFDVI